MKRAFATLLLTAAVPLLAACFGGGDDKPVAEPTPEPTPPLGSGPAEQALGNWVQTTLGKSYLEDCTKATVERDTGKTCSVFRGERGNMRAYVLGTTFSEATQWAFVQERNGQWNVIQAQPITPETAAIPGVPWPLAPGNEVVVVGTAPECLNVREGPALNQKAVDCIKEGTKIVIAAGPSMGDNLTWWQVQGRSGWVASTYLRFPDALQ